jgi:hypothetical protein
MSILPWAGCWDPEPCDAELGEYRDKGEPDRKLESDEKSLTIAEGELEPWNMHNVLTVWQTSFSGPFIWYWT